MDKLRLALLAMVLLASLEGVAFFWQTSSVSLSHRVCSMVRVASVDQWLRLRGVRNPRYSVMPVAADTTLKRGDKHASFGAQTWLQVAGKSSILPLLSFELGALEVGDVQRALVLLSETTLWGGDKRWTDGTERAVHAWAVPDIYWEEHDATAAQLAFVFDPATRSGPLRHASVDEHGVLAVDVTDFVRGVLRRSCTPARRLNVVLISTVSHSFKSKEGSRLPWSCGFSPALVVLHDDSVMVRRAGGEALSMHPELEQMPLYDRARPASWSVNVTTTSESACVVPKVQPDPYFFARHAYPECLRPVPEVATLDQGWLRIHCRGGHSAWYSTDSWDTPSKWKKVALHEGRGEFRLDAERAVVCCSAGRSLMGSLQAPQHRDDCNLVSQVVAKEKVGSGGEGKPLAVSLFVLDSVSRAHFFRSMRESVRAMRELQADHKVVVFHRYGTVGLSTAGNLPIMLGGKKYPPRGAWVLELANKAGFATHLAEETCAGDNSVIRANRSVIDHLAPGANCGNPRLWGETEASVRAQRQYCVGGRRHASLLVEHAGKFARAYERRRRMSLMLALEPHMPSESFVQTIDPDVAHWMRTVANNSVVGDDECRFSVLASDHGSRQMGYPQTHGGGVEERLPVLVVIAPKRPGCFGEEALAALEANGDRFVTGFDLYKTLVELMGQPLRRQWPLQKAVSLLAPIPAARTHVEAGTDAMYSPCTQRTLPECASVRGNVYWRYAEAAVAFLNGFVAGVCPELHLTFVSSVVVLEDRGVETITVRFTVVERAALWKLVVETSAADREALESKHAKAAQALWFPVDTKRKDRHSPAMTKERPLMKPHAAKMVSVQQMTPWQVNEECAPKGVVLEYCLCSTRAG